MSDLFDTPITPEPAPRLVYGPRPIRRRATKSDVAERRFALYQIIEAQKPMTVRQVFYRATVKLPHFIPKTEAGYKMVKNDLKLMRQASARDWEYGESDTPNLPYHWLADSTRWQRKPVTYNSVEDALWAAANNYRAAMWRDSDKYVEVWCEKDALAGVIFPITSQYDVPLMVARGYASLSFLYSAAQAIKAAAKADKAAFIYHFGDYDPSGQDAARDIEAKLRKMAPRGYHVPTCRRLHGANRTVEPTDPAQ